MRTAIPVTWVLLAACGGGGRGAAPAAEPAPGLITGAPLPPPTEPPDGCALDDGWHFLASDPHVPLAVSGPDGFADASACCAAWARAGDTWTALDAWGAPLAEVTVTGGEGYDVTACYELTLGGLPDDSRLIVRGATPWQAPSSARWEPTAAERAAALELAAAIDLVAATPGRAESPEPLPPLDERIHFFTMPGDAGDPDIATRHAAIGGRALAIIAIDPTGAWRVSYLDLEWGLAAGPWTAEPYRLLAIADLDADGFPELVAHRTDGPSWDDVILQCSHDSTLRPWRLVAESVGGSTA